MEYPGGLKEHGKDTSTELKGLTERPQACRARVVHAGGHRRGDRLRIKVNDQLLADERNTKFDRIHRIPRTGAGQPVSGKIEIKELPPGSPTPRLSVALRRVEAKEHQEVKHYVAGSRRLTASASRCGSFRRSIAMGSPDDEPGLACRTRLPGTTSRIACASRPSWNSPRRRRACPPRESVGSALMRRTALRAGRVFDGKGLRPADQLAESGVRSSRRSPGDVRAGNDAQAWRLAERERRPEVLAADRSLAGICLPGRVRGQVPLRRRRGQLAEYAWYSANSDGRTHAVGTKQKPNAWAWVADMHGFGAVDCGLVRSLTPTGRISTVGAWAKIREQRCVSAQVAAVGSMRFASPARHTAGTSPNPGRDARRLPRGGGRRFEPGAAVARYRPGAGEECRRRDRSVTR